MLEVWITCGAHGRSVGGETLQKRKSYPFVSCGAFWKCRRCFHLWPTARKSGYWQLDQVHLAYRTHKFTKKVTPNHEPWFMNWIGVPKKLFENCEGGEREGGEEEEEGGEGGEENEKKEKKGKRRKRRRRSHVSWQRPSYLLTLALKTHYEKSYAQIKGREFFNHTLWIS